MGTAETALRDFARLTRRRVRPANDYNSNVGELVRHQVRWRHEAGYRITVLAADTRLACEVRGLDGPVAFAWNAPDRICLMDDSLAAEGLPQAYLDRSAEHSQAALVWLRSPAHTALATVLELRGDESLQVYHNAIVAIVRPTRDVNTLVNALTRLADALPRTVATNQDFRGQLPLELADLERFLSAWAKFDDDERALRWRRASAARAAVVAAVVPRFDAINAYLDSFGEQPLPEVAQRLGALAEAVAELQASEA